MKLPSFSLNGLILKRKFAMVGESEPIVITDSEVCGSTPLSSTVQGQGPNPMLWYGTCGTDVGRKRNTKLFTGKITLIWFCLVPFILRHLYFVDFDSRMHFFPKLTVCLGVLAGICLGCQSDLLGVLSTPKHPRSLASEVACSTLQALQLFREVGCAV
jgi:hypothetical protein